MPKQVDLYQPLKLFIADVCLLKTSWKAVPQSWAGSRKTSFHISVHIIVKG